MPNQYTSRPAHGLGQTPEYQTWMNMRDRCLNKNKDRYSQWGGRGITICPEWDDFRCFYADMGPKPSPAHSLDRINVDGPYAPWNCRWATRSEQQRNRRDNIWLTHQGKTMLLGDWAKETGIHRNTLDGRFKRGWPAERILSPTPSRATDIHNQAGERNFHAKLNEAQVRTIRERHASGEATLSLAQEYGVADAHVWRIVNRQRWTHII
jgi:hypothetical protein